MRCIGLMTLLCALLALGCVSASGESGGISGQSPVIGEPVTLKPGERATFQAERLQVRFDRVVSDSRCPRGAQCVWAGEATVRLTVTLPDRSTKAIDVKTSLTDAATTVGAFQITVNDLTPLPTVDGPVREADYRVTLVVGKG